MKTCHTKCCIIFTRGQFWPSGIAIACVCVSVRVPVCVCINHLLVRISAVQVSITKFRSEMQKTLVKMPIILGGDRPWPSRSNLTWKSNFTSLYPTQRSWRGVYWIHLVRLSVCPSVRPSVCRQHGFRSISQVCFGISISNFICMLMVAIGRSLLIFSDVTFKMAAWRPYWIFWFPDSYFTLALNINFKLQRHNTYVYG